MRVIFPTSAISCDGRVYVSRTNLIRSKHIFHGSRTQRHITRYSKKTKEHLSVAIQEVKNGAQKRGLPRSMASCG